MEIRLPHKHFDIDHLNKVIAEMLILGPPQIKAVNCGEYYVALEGSHRLRAAKVLGISPIIEEIKYTEELTTNEIIPGQYQENWTIAEICDDSYESIQLSF